MNKYKNRNSRSQILTSQELASYAELVIQISLGNVVPQFPETNNSNPSSIVCLQPIKPIPYSRGYIGSVQWEEVLKPVVEKCSSFTGVISPRGSLIEVENTVIGRTEYWEGAVVSLFESGESTFIDLVRKMIIQQANEKGYGV